MLHKQFIEANIVRYYCVIARTDIKFVSYPLQFSKHCLNPEQNQYLQALSFIQ